jgi:hypothetical protein
VRLELDHIFCIVDDLVQASRRFEHDGRVLDRGSAHEGQGTRNRRLAWPEHHLELLCVVDRVEARASRLRLDRRAEWASTDVSLFGCGFRGVLPDVYRDDYWLYEGSGPASGCTMTTSARPHVLSSSCSRCRARRWSSAGRAPGHPDLFRHRHVGTLSESASADPRRHRCRDTPGHRPPRQADPTTSISSSGGTDRRNRSRPS